MVKDNDFIKNIKAGRPTKYDYDIHAKMLMDIFNKALGVASFCAEAMISKKTFYNWLNTHADFKEVYDVSINISEKIWEEMPRIDKDINFPYWSMIMRNRFNYGKLRIRMPEEATPEGRINAVWKFIEDGGLTGDEISKLANLITAQVNINANQPIESTVIKRDTMEEILEKIRVTEELIEKETEYKELVNKENKHDNK